MKRACGFIIYRRLTDGVQYLLLQASNGTHHWSPPKGHVELGETDLQTAYRETLEETGITEEVLDVHENMQMKLNYMAFGKEKATIYFLARLTVIDTPIVISHEHQSYKWLYYPEALEFAVFTDMQDAIKKCQECLDK